MNHHSLMGYLKRSLSACLVAALLVGPGKAVSAGQPRPLGLDPPVINTTGMSDGTAAWGDFDNDGDLDVIETGIGNGEVPKTILFKNETNGVTIALGEISSLSSGLPDVESSSAAWGDYDKDGYQDVLMTGMLKFTGQVIATTAVYHNVAGPNGTRVFTDINAGLPAVFRGAADWGDYDADGDLDILLTGYRPDLTPFAQVYRNNGDHTFSSLNLSLPGVGDSAAAWGDYTGDGLPDFAIAGMTASGPLTRLYLNKGGGAFISATALLMDLPNLYSGTINWVDVNTDGCLDLFLTGNAGPNNEAGRLPSTRLYQNTCYDTFNLLLNSATGLPSMWNTSTDWADYDNDGDPDLLISGQTFTYAYTNIYINELAASGKFRVDMSASLTEGYRVSVAWGDINSSRAGDPESAGTPDVLLTGVNYKDPNGNVWYATFVYRNVPTTPPPASQTITNLPPAAPTQLAACWDRADGVSFRAAPPADDHTPAPGITYNLRLTKTSGSTQIVIVNPSASTSTGVNRLAAPGRGQPALTVLGLERGPRYYWSVQGVDSALAGGPFATQKSFVLGQLTTQDDSATTKEDTPVSIDVLANDDSGVVIQSVERAAHGTTQVQAGQILYTPFSNYAGPDSFDYYAVDGAGYCVIAHVTVTVTQSSDPPSLAWKDAQGVRRITFPVAVEMSSDGKFQPFKLTMVGLDPDPGEVLTWSILTPAARGTAAAAGTTTSGQDKAIGYTPDRGYIGGDAFVVRVTDKTGKTAQGAVSVNVVGKVFLPLAVK